VHAPLSASLLSWERPLALPPEKDLRSPCLTPYLGSEPPPSDKDLDVAFVLADADQSGLVDLGEFTKLYKLIKVGRPPFPP
jgi:hypothetical protein